jgi:hypothetical protein
MPLVGDARSQPFLHKGLRGVGFAMLTDGDASPERVRVIVTWEALAQATHVNIIRFPVALACFDSLRIKVEAAASKKFGRIGPEIEAFEGVPTLLLMTSDPM